MLFIDAKLSNHINTTCSDGSTVNDGATIAFQRNLEHVLAKAYEVQYPDLPFRNLIPVSTEVNPGADTITYSVYDQVGVAELISAYGKDLPRADVFAKQVKSPVAGGGIAFGYNTQEVRASSMAGGQPLEQRKANASRRANEELFNRIAMLGDADTGLPGFLTNPNITSGSVPNGAGGNPEWDTKTPDEILADINNIFSGINELTNGVESPNTLLLPIKQWNYIAATKVSALATMTIMQYVIANSPFVNSAADIVKVPQLAGAGAGSTDLMVAYDKNPEKLEAHIPMEQMFHAPQLRGLEVVIPSESRTGGTIIYLPLSVSIANDI